MESYDRGTTIREPSTANFLIASVDRPPTQTASNFTIAKKNSLFNGFFTRFGVAEVVLDWGIPNISEELYANSTFSILDASANPHTVTFAPGNYTVAQTLEFIVAALNQLAIAGYTFELNRNQGPLALANVNASNNEFTIVPGETQEHIGLPEQLGFTTGSQAQFQGIFNPNLLENKYIDFVSTDLTYNQALKDATTDVRDRTVLYRWWFAWDESPPLDVYGFPILQGYTPFVARRVLPFPKQIRWENNMPIGSVNFQVFDSVGNILNTQSVTGNDMNWGMQLLVSEN
jgi:hypothetical protein